MRGPAPHAGIFIGILFAIAAAVAVSVWYLSASAGAMNKRASDLELAAARIQVEMKETEGRFESVGNVGQLIGFAKLRLKEHHGGDGALLLLERSTIPEVMIQQIAADSAGTLVLSVRARDFEAVTRQLLVWNGRSEIVASKIAGLNAVFDRLGDLEGVDFTATLQVAPELFLFDAFRGE